MCVLVTHDFCKILNALYVMLLNIIKIWNIYSYSTIQNFKFVDAKTGEIAIYNDYTQ